MTLVVCLLLLWMMPGASAGQETHEQPILTPAPMVDAPNESIETSRLDAGEDDDPRPRRRLIKWNEYDGRFTTLRFGFGFLTDFSTYVQNDESEEQFQTLHGDVGLRDFRLLARGRLKTERPISWTFGYMYDSADDVWRVRQTGIQIGFPELKGNLFIGRTKEGFSMIKVMTGYHPWTMERSPGLDAFVPILADGLKWMGWFPGSRVFFSLGAFGDEISEDESFSTYDHQVVTRAGWLPIASEEDKTVWHMAVMSRVGKPDEGKISFKSRPEDSLATFFVETPSVEADLAGTTGFETYYRRGPWLFGGEFDRQDVNRKFGSHLSFIAADAAAVWIMTGETRAYNAQGGYFEPVSPDRPVFQGGPGAWEGVLHVSYIDLDDENIAGGKLWRLTSLMNWYLSDNVRLEGSYAYGILDRFGLSGGTHFFQARVQLTL